MMLTMSAWRTLVSTLVLTVTASAIAASPAAHALPAVELELVAAVDFPLYVTHAGDDRLFIVERKGTILVHTEADGVLPVPFLDLTGPVSTVSGGGLYTIAFHPDYATNGFFYVSYTAPGSPLLSVIARYEVSASDPNRADPNSAAVLLSFAQPTGSHNNTQVAFSPVDGYLYIGTGDGAQPGECLAQENGLFGKISDVDPRHDTNMPPYRNGINGVGWIARDRR